MMDNVQSIKSYGQKYIRYRSYLGVFQKISIGIRSLQNCELKNNMNNNINKRMYDLYDQVFSTAGEGNDSLATKETSYQVSSLRTRKLAWLASMWFALMWFASMW